MVRDLMRLEPVTSFEAIRTEWSALAETAGSFFGTPEWLETWWRHYGKGRRLLLHACRGETGELIAVLPLYVWRTRPRVIRFLGHGPGDELGPVNARSDAAVAVYALRQLLDELVWDVFLGEQLPGDGNWPTQLEMPRWRTEESPRLATPERRGSFAPA